jgi:hypothetical protein
MKKILGILLVISLISCQSDRVNQDDSFNDDPFADYTEHIDKDPFNESDEISVNYDDDSFSQYDFDLLENQDLITSVDLILFEGYTDHDSLGKIVTKNTFILNGISTEVKKNIKDIEWQANDFNKILQQHDKDYEREGDCFCQPNYVFALRFQIEGNEGGFGDTGFEDSEKEDEVTETTVAYALFDEYHNSIIISDYKNSVHYYEFIDQGKTNHIVIQYINKVLNKLKIAYKDPKGFSKEK